MTAVVGVARVVKAAVAAPARGPVLVIDSAKTVLSALCLQLERLVQEFEVSVLALKVVSVVSVPSQGWFLSFAARWSLELLGLFEKKKHINLA